MNNSSRAAARRGVVRGYVLTRDPGRGSGARDAERSSTPNEQRSTIVERSTWTESRGDLREVLGLDHSRTASRECEMNRAQGAWDPGRDAGVSGTIRGATGSQRSGRQAARVRRRRVHERSGSMRAVVRARPAGAAIDSSGAEVFPSPGPTNENSEGWKAPPLAATAIAAWRRFRFTSRSWDTAWRSGSSRSPGCRSREHRP